ncbi:XopAP family type III secretion system effector [Xanthomonas euvesicatoria]|uniref:XopAP family type III secretion system effector n=1 Tax=Xanthomonas euvesicatoria TaxID=456327 RepID=UPI003D18E0B5
MRPTSTSFPSLPHAQSRDGDSDMPASATAFPWHARDSASAFPGLSAAPVKRGRNSTRSITAGAWRSSGMCLPQVDTQACDLVSAIAQVDRASAQPHGQDPQWEMRCRTVLESMRACAGESYKGDPATVADIDGLHLNVPMSTRRLKLWERETDDVIVAVLGFSGTCLNATDDLLCDMKSQIAQVHVNVFDERLPTLGRVGAGWQEWWQSEAQLPRADGTVMKDVLKRYTNRARESGKALSMSLTGHSLGAAAATLAGFDITHFLRAAGAPGKISIYSFNPPRLGPAGADTHYMQSLRSNDSELRFTLRQFTRALDPIQSVPFFMHHPHWDHPGAADERAGSTSGDRFAQFITVTDGPASTVNLADNHELTLWRSYFLSKIEPGDLQRIFSPMEVSQGTSEDRRLPRRQLFTSWLPYRQPPATRRPD